MATREKRWRIFIGLGLVFSILGRLAFTPATIEHAVTATYPALQAMDHLTNPKKVAAWMEPFASSYDRPPQITPESVILDQDTVVIVREGPVDVRYRRSSGTFSANYRVTAEPPVDSPRQSIFHLSYVSPNWLRLTGGNAVDKGMKRSLDRLRTYFSDPVALYGYPVKKITVTDTVFLFASREIDAGRFAEATDSLFDFLITEAKQRNVPYNGVRIFHYEDREKGRRAIFAGVGIDRPIETPKGDVVICKRMPYGHDLLAVDYEGPYHGIRQVNEAIEAYRNDNKLVSMAIPFHKYLSDGYGFTDSQTVKLRVCYPVY